MNQYELRALYAEAEQRKRRPCEHCQAGVENIEMYRTIKSDGTSLYYWFCTACGRRAVRGPDEWGKAENIKHALLDFWVEQGKFPGITDKEQFPLLHVYEGKPCAVRGCEDTETQRHHWAPQKMAPAFGPDWDRWPTVYLCKYHHRQWHDIVTPALVRYNEKVEDFESIFREAAGL